MISNCNSSLDVTLFHSECKSKCSHAHMLCISIYVNKYAHVWSFKFYHVYSVCVSNHIFTFLDHQTTNILLCNRKISMQKSQMMMKCHRLPGKHGSSNFCWSPTLPPASWDIEWLVPSFSPPEFCWWGQDWFQWWNAHTLSSQPDHPYLSMARCNVDDPKRSGASTQSTPINPPPT